MLARLSLYIVAALLIAAHFLRDGNLIGVALCLAAPLLFLVRRRWSLLVLQGLAFVAAGLWLGAAWHLVAIRQLLGQPWVRGATILVGVAAFSILAGAVLAGARFQTRYCGR